MNSSLGVDNKLVALQDLKSSNHSDLLNLLKYDPNNFAFCDVVLSSDLIDDSQFNRYVASFDFDALGLSFSVGETKSVICCIETKLPVNPSAGDPLMFSCGFNTSTGKYLFSLGSPSYDVKPAYGLATTFRNLTFGTEVIVGLSQYNK